MHNVAAIASGIVRAGADYVYLDGFRGGTGAAPQVIRDHVGIPLEIAIAVVDQRLRDEGIRNQASIIAAGSHPLLGRHGQGDRARRRRRRHRLGGAHRARLPPVPGLPHRQLLAGGSPRRSPSSPAALDPEWGAERLVNLVHAWSHELQEILGALGVNAVESLRGSRERLRGVGLDAQTCEILGVKPAGL